MQAEPVLFAGSYTELKMLPMNLYPKSVYVEGGSTYNLYHICFVTKPEESSEVPQHNSFTLLDNFQTQFYAEQKLLPAFPSSRAPKAEGFSFFGAYNILPYGCEGTGGVLLCLIVHSSSPSPPLFSLKAI